jgi:hypothetical protein
MSGRWNTITKFLIFVLVALSVAYDVLAYVRGGVDSTISRVVLAWAQRWPPIPFSVGVLCGHLFWPQPQAKE